MSRSLPWLILVCLLTVLHGPTDAKNQKRNFNLNCGLIGNFAQYPQHNQLCKWQTFCTDPKTCMRKLAVPQEEIEAVLSPEESGVPAAGEPPSDGGLSLSVGVQGSVSAGGISAGGSVGAGAGTDSDGGVSGGANAGANAGADGASAGGGLGTGGL
jgi:hypothetical protein